MDRNEKHSAPWGSTALRTRLTDLCAGVDDGEPDIDPGPEVAEESEDTPAPDEGGQGVAGRSFLDVYEELRDLNLTLISVPRAFREIRRDLRRRLKDSPGEVVEEVLELLLATDIELLLRNKLMLDRLLKHCDEQADRGAPLAPDDAIVLIDRLDAQQRCILELLVLRARVLTAEAKGLKMKGS
ncbi:MAG: hypothetical protein HQ559_08545 [Lentisphaerae bacterium]|nr:hypothetical protein [Lentisphaerota bacterium]